MAIQFHCPYCTTAILVPDEAAGKVGTCPKCTTRVRVPQVERPDEVQFQLVENIDSVPEDDDQPVVDSAVTDLPDPLAEITAITSSEPGPVVGRTKKRPGPPMWLAPVLVFALVAIAGGVWLYLQRPRYDVDIAAEVIEDAESIAVQIPWKSIDVEQIAATQAGAYFAKTPVLMRSELIEIRISGSSTGLIIQFVPGKDAVLARVNPRKIETVDKYVSLHEEQLDAPRLRELTQGTKSLAFAASIASATRPVEGIQDYREPVCLNSLVRGLGYHSIAVVGNETFPCVHENREGWLYFVLPKGTRTFTVRERRWIDRPRVLPESFELRSVIPAAAPPVPDSDTAPAPAPNAPATPDAAPASSAPAGQPATTEDEPAPAAMKPA